MTCLLESPWQPSYESLPWSSMNPEDTPTDSLERAPSHGYASSGSESRNRGSGSGKKRASRAGTRSVSTLSAAQLERKRANDREAQRAIRQRTKDHIDILERSISELRTSQDASEKLVVATQQKNRELEEENVYLRTRLSDAGLTMNVPATENQRQSEPAMLPVQAVSPEAQTTVSSIQRPASTSTPRSLSVTTTQSSVSRHGSWQHNVYSSSVPASAMSVPGSSTPGALPNLTTWRSHDGMQTMSTSGRDAPDPPQTASSYGGPPPLDRSHWPNQVPQYPYTIQEQPSPQYQPPAQQQQSYQHPPPQQQPQHPQQYAQTPVQTFQTAPAPLQTPQQPPYQPPQMPPQAEFQNMSVSSSASYQLPHAQHFAQPSQYIPMAGEYAPPHGQMQPPPMPQPPYQAAPPEQAYGQQQQTQQQQHPPVRYAGNPNSRSYSLSHFPPG